MSKLFRDKALEAKRDAWIGRVQTTQSVPVNVVAFIGMLLLALSVADAILGHYTRRGERNRRSPTA